jgi:hypothetical protein
MLPCCRPADLAERQACSTACTAGSASLAGDRNLYSDTPAATLTQCQYLRHTLSGAGWREGPQHASRTHNTEQRQPCSTTTPLHPFPPAWLVVELVSLLHYSNNTRILFSSPEGTSTALESPAFGTMPCLATVYSDLEQVCILQHVIFEAPVSDHPTTMHCDNERLCLGIVLVS